MRRLIACWTAALALSAGLVLSAALAGAEPLTPPQLKAARKLYTTKCAKCHQLYDPKSYSQAEWQAWVQKMSRKAKLKPDQEELLFRYWETLSAGPKPAPR